MALTTVDYSLWQELRDRDLIQARPAVLEFGQSNWYGDVSPERLDADLAKYADPSVLEAIRVKIAQGFEAKNLFAIAAGFWKGFLNPSEFVSVDMHAQPGAYNRDLNEPLDLPLDYYDLLINSGTAEHIFDQRQLFESAHAHTKPGGLMVHALPLHGWLLHGFVNYQPTIIADLAACNGYEIVLWWWVEMDTANVVRVSETEDFRQLAARFGTRLSSMMYVVFRKPAESRPFTVPQQGYYAGRLDVEGKRAWRNER